MEGDTLYQRDMEAGRLAVGGVSPLSKIGLRPKYYQVTSRFLKEYSEPLPNSLMYLSTCDSLKKDYESGHDFALDMKRLAPGAIIGFDSRVLPSYTARVGKVFFAYLLGGYTVEEARDNAKKEVSGLWNYIAPSVDIVLSGKNHRNLRITDKSLKNGSFESLTMPDWHCILSECSIFDNSIGSNYAYLFPVPDGKNAFRLGSRVGYTSGVTQINKISKDAKMLSFSYAYDISASSINGTPKPCEGRFEAWITYGEEYNKFHFFKVFYDDLASQPLIKRECQESSDDKTFCYDSYYKPWKEVKIPLPSAIIGARINLEFYSISDRGYDNHCSSFLYLDNISIQ